jgi:hypothetical protein
MLWAAKALEASKQKRDCHVPAGRTVDLVQIRSWADDTVACALKDSLIAHLCKLRICLEVHGARVYGGRATALMLRLCLHGHQVLVAGLDERPVLASGKQAVGKVVGITVNDGSRVTRADPEVKLHHAPLKGRTVQEAGNRKVTSHGVRQL